jgi:hypothetical protein
LPTPSAVRITGTSIGGEIMLVSETMRTAEPGTMQTHNVVATLPGQAGYSPLWDVRPYDNAAFDMVMDLASAQAAPSFGMAALVNCPVVSVQ